MIFMQTTEGVGLLSGLLGQKALWMLPSYELGEPEVQPAW